MAEEVEIKIKATGAEDATSKLERLKKEASELHRVADFRSSQGDQAGAKFARQDAVKIEREITGLKREGAQQDRASARAAKEASAEKKLVESGRTRMGRALGSALDNVTGGTTAGNLVGGMIGNTPMGMIARLVTAATVGVVGAFGAQSRELGVMGARDNTAGAVQRRRFARMEFEGSGAQAYSEQQSAYDEITERTARRGEIGERKKFRWNDPRSWRPMDRMTGAIGNEERENEMGLARARERAGEAGMQKRELFKQTGAQELAAQRARISGNFAEAHSLSMSQYAFKRYKELRSSGASVEEAREGAGMVLRERSLSVMRGLGGLAGARDGSANLAALASLGKGFSTEAASEKLGELIAVNRRAEEAADRKIFSRGP